MERSEQPSHAPLLHEHDGHHTNDPKSVAPRPSSERIQKKKQRKRPRLRTARHWKRCTYTLGRLWQQGWTAETCSCVFASLSLLDLVTTLLVHQNKPIPKWPQLVSINSIVSLFSLLIRAGVGMVLTEGISQSKWQWFRKKRTLHDMERFDLASRGAWGSILLLISLRMKKLYLIAALGAFITVMASLTGFASQQLIQFTECLQPDNTAIVSVHKSNLYFNAGPMISAGRRDIAQEMAVAIDVGILQPQEDYTRVLSSGCTTGNCTFPSSSEGTFSTLAFVHSCHNATSEVKQKFLYETITYENGTNATVPDVMDFGDVGVRQAYNLTLSSEEGFLEVQVYPGPLFHLVTGLFQENSSFAIKMIVRKDPLDEPSVYEAISCSFKIHVNTYAVEIKQTALEEKLIRSVPLGINQLFGKTNVDNWSLLRLATNHTLRNGSKEVCDIREEPAPGYEIISPENVEASPSYYPNSSNLTSEAWYMPEDCVWTFGYISYTGIMVYLSGIFDQQKVMMERWETAGSYHLRQLWRDGNMTLDTVDQAMKDLATSMTAAIRTTEQYNHTRPVHGTVWYTTTCIRVNWYWISYPAIMIGLCAVFLILVHIESRDVESQRLWKSSTLAMLFCELDEAVVSATKPLQIDTIRDTAKSTGVSLGREAGSLKMIVK